MLTMRELKCPECNAVFIAGTKFCKNCGYNLEVALNENPTCPVCQKEFPVGAKFCDIDGSKLIYPVKPILVCKLCGAEYGSNVKFCPKDGGALTAKAFGSIEEEQAPPLLPTPSTPSTSQTPIYYEVEFDKAPLGKRIIAFLIDTLGTFFLAIPTFIFLLLASSDEGGTGEYVTMYIILAAVCYLIPVTYFFLKDGLGKGQSWGKKSVGLRVVYLPNNSYSTFGKSFLRNLIRGLLRVVPIIGWFIEFIMILVTKDGRRLGDLVAKTQVVEVVPNEPILNWQVTK